MNPEKTEVEIVLNLVERICSCSSIDDLLTDVLEQTSLLLDADTACGFEISHDGLRPWIGRAVTTKMRRDSFLSYSEHYLSMDPLYDPLFSSSRDCRMATAGFDLRRLSDCVDERNPRHRTYCADFLRPQRLDHVLSLVFHLPVKGQPLIALGFQREGKRNDFSADQLKRARMIAPSVLSRIEYLTTRRLLENAESSREDVIEMYWVTIWPNGNLTVARVPDEEESLKFKGPTEPKVFFPSVTAVINDFCDTVIPISRAEGLLNALSIKPGPTASEMFVEQESDWAGARRYKLTFLKPPQQDKWISWADVHNLTAAEKRILRPLSVGCSNKEISADTGLSIRTVENHIRSILLKSGYHSRSKMISEMLVM